MPAPWHGRAAASGPRARDGACRDRPNYPRGYRTDEAQPLEIDPGKGEPSVGGRPEVELDRARPAARDPVGLTKEDDAAISGRRRETGSMHGRTMPPADANPEGPG